MNKHDYYFTRERDLKGRQVRILRDLESKWGVIPAGTIATIIKKCGGFSLVVDPCPQCRLRAVISRVQYFDVELLPVGRGKE